MGLAVDSYLLPTSKSRDTKTTTKIKNPAPNPPDKLQVLYPNLRIRGHLPAPDIYWKEIASENGRISDFQGLVTLTLNRIILHTVMHHSSTSTYIPNYIKIEETFCGRTYGRTFETHFIRSTPPSRPKYQCTLHSVV